MLITATASTTSRPKSGDNKYPDNEYPDDSSDDDDDDSGGGGGVRLARSGKIGLGVGIPFLVIVLIIAIVYKTRLKKGRKGRTHGPEWAESTHTPNEPATVQEAPVATFTLPASGGERDNQQLELPRDGDLRTEMAKLEDEHKALQAKRARLLQLEELDERELALKQRLSVL